MNTLFCLCSSLVSPCSVLASLNFAYTAHTFFPECLCNHFQGLHHTFSEIYTKFDAVPLSDPSRNRIRPDTRLQIKERINSTFTQRREILYTDSQDVLVLSSTFALRCYNCCTDKSTSPGNYGYHLVLLYQEWHSRGNYRIQYNRAIIAALCIVFMPMCKAYLQKQLPRGREWA
jgi:hypothetical protein